MIERTENGRQRNFTPFAFATSSIRMTERYEYVLPMETQKSIVGVSMHPSAPRAV
jgi:hypothetical protein